MNILLTGAFGNIGTAFIRNFITECDQSLRLRCFDLKTVSNIKKAAVFKDRIETFWGNINDGRDVHEAVKDQDIVIHLAFIIPPLSEARPGFTKKINIDGTKKIIEALKLYNKKGRIIFGSSVSVYGPVPPEREPPLKAKDRVIATDNYTSHKIECEKMLMRSGLDWIITRFGVSPSLDFSKDIVSMVYEVPLNARIEFVHSMDVGLALFNIIGCKRCSKKILLIGGGEECRLHQREFLARFLEVYGIGMLPEKAFSTRPYYTDWLDTRESQKLLNYQKRTFDDFIDDIRKRFGPRRYLIKIIKPVIRKFMLSKSPYYNN